MMTQLWKQRERVDPLRAREYFHGLLGKGVGEWGLRKDKDIFRTERRWEEELDIEIEMEEIHNYLRKAKNGKAVGVRWITYGLLKRIM
jgi:hypothetical protein